MKYIGLDCQKKYDHATMINTETGEIKSKRLAHTVEEFQEFIGERAGTRVVMESCWNWSKTYEVIKELVEEVTLAHPLKVKAIASAKIKTDAIDTRTLTELPMADLIPQAHLRKAENRVRQRVVRHRAFLVAMRTRVKCRVHGLVDSQLLSAEMLQAKPRYLFSKKGRKWLRFCVLTVMGRVISHARQVLLRIADRILESHRPSTKEDSASNLGYKLRS